MRVQLLMIVAAGWSLAAEVHGQDAVKSDMRNALPPGAIARVPRQPPQPPPLMQLLSAAVLGLQEPPPGQRSHFSLLTFSPDGKQLAIAIGENLIRLVEVATGKEIAQFPKQDHFIHVLRYSDDGKLLAVSTFWNERIQKISLWEVATGKTIREFQVHEKRVPKNLTLSLFGVSHLTLSPDGRMLAGAKDYGQPPTIHIWKVATDKLGKSLVPNQWVPGPYRFSPDSKRLVSSDHYINGIQLWEIATGKELGRLAGVPQIPSGWRYQFAFTPDGQAVASGLEDNTICLWQVPSGKEIRRFQGHDHRTLYLAFSPNGLTLASASQDKTVRLWDVMTGQEIRTWLGHAGATGVAFSPDGRKIASACENDGTVFIWDVTGAADALPQILAQKLEQLWDDLASFDAGKAHRAFWTMAARPRDSVAFLNQRMSPVRAPDVLRIEQLISDLKDGQFVKRQKALRQLEEIVEVAEPNLRAALKAGSQTLEGRRRIDSLLAGLAETSPKRLLQLRAVAVLEAIGTTEAITLLESLACGAKEGQLTRESRAALNRLEKHNIGIQRFIKESAK